MHEGTVYWQDNIHIRSTTRPLKMFALVGIPPRQQKK